LGLAQPSGRGLFGAARGVRRLPQQLRGLRVPARVAGVGGLQLGVCVVGLILRPGDCLPRTKRTRAPNGRAKGGGGRGARVRGSSCEGARGCISA
jgi:hypothetical protein